MFAQPLKTPTLFAVKVRDHKLLRQFLKQSSTSTRTRIGGFIMAQDIDPSNEPHKLFDTLLVLDFGSQYVNIARERAI